MKGCVADSVTQLPVTSWFKIVSAHFKFIGTREDSVVLRVDVVGRCRRFRVGRGRKAEVPNEGKIALTRLKPWEGSFGAHKRDQESGVDRRERP
jgi:hypothetical protein